MEILTPNEYQEQAMRTNDGGCRRRLQQKLDYSIINLSGKEIEEADLVNGAMGLCGESGEVSDLLKKHIFHGEDLDLDNLKKELGDVCWYIAMICNAAGLKLEDVMRGNIEKLKRRYPDGFSEAASKHRTE